jgi:hypothetical protein
MKKQSAQRVETKYVPFGSQTGTVKMAFPDVNVYDDYDWFLTRYGIVLLSRSVLSLDT